MANARARLATCAAALLLAIAPGSAWADIPTGSFEFQLAGANSLWMGGDVDTHEDADGFCASFGAGFDYVELCDYELSVDGAGKIDGYTTFIGWLDGTRIAIEGPIKGKQRGDNRSGITRASFAIRLAGSASRGSIELDTSLSLKLVAQIDAAGVMTGTWTQKACFEGSACQTSSFPAGPSTWTDGHWTLALEVEALGAGELGGVAQVLFGDGSACDFTLSGRYDPRKDVANVTLSPVTPRCVGGSLRLRPLATRPGSIGPEFGGLLQYKLFGVSGITYVSTASTALFHPRANLSLPPASTGSSGSSGLVLVIVSMPSNLQPPGATGSSSSSSGVIVTGTLPTLDLPPAQPAAPQGASVEVVSGAEETALALSQWNLLNALLAARVDP